MNEKELREKELRIQIGQLESRLDGRIEMFCEEVDRTRNDLSKLSSLYNELASINDDDPILKMGCRASMDGIRTRVRAEYNDNISKLFRNF